MTRHARLAMYVFGRSLSSSAKHLQGTTWYRPAGFLRLPRCSLFNLLREILMAFWVAGISSVSFLYSLTLYAIPKPAISA